MWFLFKFFVFLLMAVIVGYFLITNVPSLREYVIEIINPSVKEAKVLGKLKTNLDELSGNLDAMEGSKKPDDIKAGIQKNKDLAAKAKVLIQEAATLNDSSGIIKSQIGRIINFFSDSTPYPADHLTPSSQPVPSCPISK
jgi:hypothetical protein